MKTLTLTLALSAAALSTPAFAQALSDVPINADTVLFCRDNIGEPRPMPYSNLGGVMKRYDARFHFDMSVEAGSPLMLKFASPKDSPYSITYEVAPYRDAAGRQGLLLNSMHIFLENPDPDVNGAAMCLFTEFGK